MHKPPVLIMASNNNSAHIADLGERFATATPPINIRSIGGGENDGTGVFTITVDDDSPETLQRVQEIVAQVDGVTYHDVDGITVELKNEPGSLGRVARELAGDPDADPPIPSINILSLMLIGIHGDSAIVLAGVTDPGAARSRLEARGYFVYPDEHEHAV
jgi:hypothetical protein